MSAAAKLTPSRLAADALVNAGLVQPGRADAAAAVIASHLPKGGSYSFSADAEFLHACLEHHVGTYFRQVLEPAAMSHHGGQRNGRLLTDRETSEAAVTITTQVMNELGQEYMVHMGRYLGDEAGVTAYVFSRVHAALLEAARKFNDEYLAALQRRLAGARRTLPT